MKPSTRQELEKLERAEWFSAIGRPDTEAARVLGSWSEAIKSCASDDWQNLLIEAANRYREQLLAKNRARFKTWNTVVKSVRPAAIALAERKIAAPMAAHHLPPVFAHTVKWDMVHFAVESEFADVQPPGYFASQAYWYLKGHFPCGWDGAFPEGRLVVF